ncbi:MAG TPA: hypothetical protein DCE18_08280 [Syntrophobacteraceae bacterium]|nr:hypothetical protein [Syntrophobacteraceae bacterium]HBZ56545.1 hypothetical protein [Syntrophobacteraceae bacterium]
MQVEYKNRPSERSIDPKQVVNEIRNGRSLEAVQKLFGLRFKSEVQDLYMRGLSELGEIPQMSFNKPNPAAPQETSPKRNHVRRPPTVQEKPSLIIKANNFRTIGESGTITLNKALLIEQLGFNVEDTFEIYREDDRIVLQKTASPPMIERSNGNGTRTRTVI